VGRSPLRRLGRCEVTNAFARRAVMPMRGAG
jgi:hypothetical protein